MADHRSLPLRDIALQGRFGAGVGTVGVTLSVVHPITLVSVIARKGKGKAVATALQGVKSAQVMWAGPEQYLVQGVLPAALKKLLGVSASVIDQSHGRVMICFSGPQACNVLAKGTPVDLHPAQFPIGKSALTQMAHVGVHLTRSGEDEFTLSVFRGFSESFWEWLTDSAAEFGYQIV